MLFRSPPPFSWSICSDITTWITDSPYQQYQSMDTQKCMNVINQCTQACTTVCELFGEKGDQEITECIKASLWDSGCSDHSNLQCQKCNEKDQTKFNKLSPPKISSHPSHTCGFLKNICSLTCEFDCLPVNCNDPVIYECNAEKCTEAWIQEYPSKCLSDDAPPLCTLQPA